MMNAKVFTMAATENSQEITTTAANTKVDIDQSI